MGELSKIVFKEVQEKEFEVMGHKIVVRPLNTRDSLEMDFDYTEILKDEKGGDESSVDFKSMVKNMIEVLSSVIVSIDGIKPDGREETKDFLLNQQQDVVIQIFSNADIYESKVAEEVKN